MSEISKVTAAIPPLNTIADTNTRRVLEAIITGWRTRNGDLKPDSDDRFITKGELAKLVGDINNGYFTTGAGSALLRGMAGGDDGALDMSNLANAIQNSALWTQLGERIKLIDLALITEQQARIAEVRKVADDLAAEAEARLDFGGVVGSRIDAVEDVNDQQATQISGLTTRVNGAESTIVTLQRTTVDQATQLTRLNTRVGDSESTVASLSETTAEQARTLDSLSTTVGGFDARIDTLEVTSANQASTLQVLSVGLNETNAAISNEAVARANADNAITTQVSTQMGRIETSVAAIQTSQTTVTNRVAALSNSVQTVQAQLGDISSAVQTEAFARIGADNQINAKYTVKVDANGYVSGYGLMASGNTDRPVSDFIVRADKFAIGSPEGPGITPQVPFMVVTTPQTIDGVQYPPGVYLKDAYIGRRIRSDNFVSGVDGWEINRNGNAEFNRLTVRSGQIVGALLKITNIPAFYSGMFYRNDKNSPASVPNGPYWVNAREPFYMVWQGIMPAPETAAHRIAAVTSVGSLTTDKFHDLEVIVMANPLIVPRSGGGFDVTGDMLSRAGTTGRYSMTAAGAGATTLAYPGECPIIILAGGYISYNRINIVSGLLWGVR